MFSEKILTLIEMILECDYKLIQGKVLISPNQILSFHWLITFLPFWQFFRHFESGWLNHWKLDHFHAICGNVLEVHGPVRQHGPLFGHFGLSSANFWQCSTNSSPVQVISGNWSTRIWRKRCLQKKKKSNRKISFYLFLISFYICKPCN